MFSCSCRVAVVAFASLVAWSAPAQAQKKHAAEEAGLKALKVAGESSISFTNHGSGICRIYWLDYDGKRVLRETLRPGSLFETKTAPGHPWLVTDDKDNALELYFADAQPRQIALGKTDPAQSYARNQLTLYDKNKDGKIDLNEAQASKTLNTKFAQLDANNDGLLDLGELAKNYRGSAFAKGGDPAPKFGGFKKKAGDAEPPELRKVPLDSRLAEELKLTPEQQAKFRDIAQAEEKARAALKGLSSLNARRKGADIVAASDAVLAALLKPDQKTRLQQLELQAKGSALFTDADLLAALNLNQEQTEKWSSVRSEFSSGALKISLARPTADDLTKQSLELRKASYDKVLAFLMDGQKKTWHEMVGTPSALPVGSATTGFKGGGPGFGGLAGNAVAPMNGILRTRSYAFDNWTCSAARFLKEASVQEELKLTDEQKQKLAGLSPVASAEGVLTADQLKRYRAIYMQQSMTAYGPAGPFRYKEVQDVLNLSAEQKQKILAIGQEDSDALRALAKEATPITAEKVQAVDQKTRDKIAKVLSEQQNVLLKDFIGAPFQGKIARPFGGTPTGTVAERKGPPPR